MDVIIGFDEFFKYKLDLLFINMVFERFYVSFLNVVYVGDYLNDILVVKVVNVKFIGVSYFVYYEVFLGVKLDVVVDNLEKLFYIF